MSHGGAWGGYRAELLRYPTERLSVAILCNLATTNPSALAHHVAEKFLAAKMEPATAATGARPLPPPQAVDTARYTTAELAAFAGEYASDELGVTYYVRQQGDSLLVRLPRSAATPLRPLERDRFRGPFFTLRFQREGRRMTGLLVDLGRARGVRFVRRRD